MIPLAGIWFASVAVTVYDVAVLAAFESCASATLVKAPAAVFVTVGAVAEYCDSP